MERISIFNYEAFYLDFLEGNLNEADTLMLMNFLEANPDLKVETDDMLPEFEEESVFLDDFSKLLLKTEIEQIPINSSNVDYFIIAQSEGLLDEDKANELSIFITGDKALEQNKKLAEVVFLQPNLEIVYSDKAELKQKAKTIVLWPYAASIAAASVIFFFWSVMNSSPISVNTKDATISASAKTKTKNSVTSPTNKVNQDEKHENVFPAQHHLNNNDSNETGLENKAQRERIIRVNDMKSIPVGPIASINDQKLAPILTNKTVEKTTSNPKQEEDVLALSPYVGMHNPIEPLTKFVSKKTNTEVDFQTTKKSEDRSRGFYLKIGKLEISRKKGR